MQDNRILQQLLEKELALLEELTSLSLLKKDVLLQKDHLKVLETIVYKEEALSAKLKTVNDACLPRVQFFLRNQPAETAADLPGQMNDLVKKIREQALTLHRHNQLNQALIRDSLSIVQFTLNALMPPEIHRTKVYGSTGKMLAGNHKRTYVLDSRR